MAEESQEPSRPEEGTAPESQEPEAQEAPLNRAQRRALAAGKKGNSGGSGFQNVKNAQGGFTAGSRPAGGAPRTSRASGRGK
jgi:hypothetical protein